MGLVYITFDRDNLMKAFPFILSLLTLSFFAWSEDQTDSLWHEHCNMTIHTTVDGWVAEKSVQKIKVPINDQTISCHVDSGIFFLGDWSTSAEARISASALSELKTKLRVRSASAGVFYSAGIVGSDLACEKVE